MSASSHVVQEDFFVPVEGDETYVRAWRLKFLLEQQIAHGEKPFEDEPISYISGHCKLLSPRHLQKLSQGEASQALSLEKPEPDAPLFSVVTVCLNSASFIGRAIESVLSQTHPSFEYVIQDGGSIDGTCDIIQSYAAKARINWVSKPDKATLDGMLRAVKRCRGKYIAVCWADDELLPRALEWAEHKFRQSDADIIYGDQILANDMTGTQHITRGNTWDGRRFFFNQFYPPFSSSYFSRDILLKLGELLKTFDHDEYEFWCLLDQLGKIRYVPGITSKFHIHERTSWMHEGAPKHIARMRNGKHKALERMAGLNMLPYPKEVVAPMVDLWAALHLLYNAPQLEDIVGYLEQAVAGYNGDHRYYAFVPFLGNALIKAYDEQRLSFA